MTAAIHRRRPVKLGFAGLGWIGLHRMKAILESKDAVASAFCDASPEAVERAMAHCAHEAHHAVNFRDLLTLDLDGVVIATPSALHAEQTIAALTSGYSVFCQKPLGRSAVEVRRAVETARAAGRLLHVDFSYRFTQAAQMIRSLVAAGELGEVFACDLTFHNAYGPDKPWFYDVAQSGGGCVMDLGVHLVDLALWILPDARIETVDAALFRNGKRLHRPSTCVEDYAVAHLRLNTGAQMRIACSWNLHAGCDAVISTEFHGAKGGARMRNVGGSFYDFIAERFTRTDTEILCEPPDAWGGRAAVHWTRTLAASRAFDATADEYERVAEAIDAIYGRNPTY